MSSVADALNTVASTFKLSAGTDGVAVDDNDLEDFYSDEIRVGYDDLATASLTEFSHFMYFYNIVDEPVAVPVVLEDGPDLDQA
ncbi:MAG: hypothetical protein HKN43_03265 [Rhodothermales bacterium]|nr:hypothetical protein [Rhodothermales bacterium]